tara:strand:+ start:198 stop:527 length:330 start_codon:yes stop_codon:yes gene_type:complete
MSRVGLTRGSEVGSNAPTIASRITPSMKIHEYSQEINNIFAEQDRRFANSLDDAIKKKTVVHFADSSITLPDLYGLVLKNDKVLRLLVPMINGIIQKLIDCIREETFSR